MMIDGARELKTNEDDDSVTRWDDDAHAYLYTHTYTHAHAHTYIHNKNDTCRTIRVIRATLTDTDCS